ncbi:hypothetical protein PanWU01x14_037420, partial [Parasponia andersonii]
EVAHHLFGEGRTYLCKRDYTVKVADNLWKRSHITITEEIAYNLWKRSHITITEKVELNPYATLGF